MMPPELTLPCLVLLVLAFVCLPVPPEQVRVRNDQAWWGEG